MLPLSAQLWRFDPKDNNDKCGKLINGFKKPLEIPWQFQNYQWCVPLESEADGGFVEVDQDCK